ncbi:hypothetical protein PIB30_060587 [Stylosanthes scabra]|uniref:Uncharacterized protein n=1 Tax=Stylosanthes scabra TaxID=79078 RepID=A0ABU6ZJA9_9FABA|nr:hypothetical protein [Stylosanthes scabra]
MMIAEWTTRALRSRKPCVNRSSGSKVIATGSWRWRFGNFVVWSVPGQTFGEGSRIRCGVSNPGSVNILLALAPSSYAISQAKTSLYRIEISTLLCYERQNACVVAISASISHSSHSFQPKTLSPSFFSQFLPLFSNPNLTSLHPLPSFLHQSLKLIWSLLPFLASSSHHFPSPSSLVTSTLSLFEGARSLKVPHLPCDNESSKKILKSYLDIFSKLPVLKPKYLSEGLLPEDKYEVFWKLVDQQGLRPLLFMKERLLTLGVEASSLSSVLVVILVITFGFGASGRRLLA